METKIKENVEQIKKLEGFLKTLKSHRDNINLTIEHVKISIDYLKQENEELETEKSVLTKGGKNDK